MFSYYRKVLSQQKAQFQYKLYVFNIIETVLINFDNIKGMNSSISSVRTLSL